MGTKKVLSAEHKAKISASLKGKKKQPFSEEHKRNLSKAGKGRITSKETLQKLSIARKGHKGIVWSDEKKEQISNSLKKWNKKNESHNKGRVFTEEHRLKLSKAHKGKILTPEHKAKIGASVLGKHHTEEAKQKIRVAFSNRMEQYGKCTPNFNVKACEYFNLMDEENGSYGQYAMYGGGEYHIKELGYWLDYINFDLKLIIEWDEEKHYNNKGNLSQKDVQRQEEIQRFYSDFEFRRIREKEVYVS